jgi:beta-aspartyl-peptidase (threonine type)
VLTGGSEPYRIEVMTTQRPAIIVHGGAGKEDPDERAPRRLGCLEATRQGWEVLQRGGSAVDAAIAAVVHLEDDIHFNAGTGSCLTDDGRIEMDASVMQGTTLAAGAVGAVERVKNPVLLARAVMDDGRHVLLVGPQALAFARSRGVPQCDPGTLLVERQRRRRDVSQPVEETGGSTVGAVAVDGEGHVAAATSTGGIMGKLAGRVGDSAIIGAGTYADDESGAASATGFGEPIMRLTLARVAVDLLGSRLDPRAACRRALQILERRLDAHCGLIVADPTGRVGSAFTTAGMPVAFMHRGLEAPTVAPA